MGIFIIPELRRERFILLLPQKVRDSRFRDALSHKRRIENIVYKASTQSGVYVRAELNRLNFNSESKSFLK